MPIKPENKKLYPKNWKEIRQKILERANNKCEFCGVENHRWGYRNKNGDFVISEGMQQEADDAQATYSRALSVLFYIPLQLQP